MQLAWQYFEFYGFPTPEEDHFLQIGTIYFKLGNFEKAISYFVKSEEAHGHRDVIYTKYNLQYLGLCYLASENPNKALEIFEKLSQVAPKDEKAYMNLVFIYLKLGKHKETIEACKKALELKPDYADAHVGIGVAHYKLGMYKEAIEAYKKAIEYNVDSAGLAYLTLHDKDSATREYEILKSLDPHLADTLLKLINK